MRQVQVTMKDDVTSKREEKRTEEDVASSNM